MTFGGWRTSWFNYPLRNQDISRAEFFGIPTIFRTFGFQKCVEDVIKIFGREILFNGFSSQVREVRKKKKKKEKFEDNDLSRNSNFSDWLVLWEELQRLNPRFLENEKTWKVWLENSSFWANRGLVWLCREIYKLYLKNDLWLVLSKLRRRMCEVV